jgi:hypothetical protein
MKRFILDGFGVLAFQRGLLAPGAIGAPRGVGPSWRGIQLDAGRGDGARLRHAGRHEALHADLLGVDVPGDRTDARPHKYALTSTPTCRRGPVAGGRATSTRTPAAKAAWTLACGS